MHVYTSIHMYVHMWVCVNIPYSGLFLDSFYYFAYFNQSFLFEFPQLVCCHHMIDHCLSAALLQGDLRLCCIFFLLFNLVAKKLPDPLLKFIPPSSIQDRNDAYIEPLMIYYYHKEYILLIHNYGEILFMPLPSRPWRSNHSKGRQCVRSRHPYMRLTCIQQTLNSVNTHIRTSQQIFVKFSIMQ